jgi:hypothetical protein
MREETLIYNENRFASLVIRPAARVLLTTYLRQNSSVSLPSDCWNVGIHSYPAGERCRLPFSLRQVLILMSRPEFLVPSCGGLRSLGLVPPLLIRVALLLLDQQQYAAYKCNPLWPTSKSFTSLAGLDLTGSCPPRRWARN